jgi:hypothetical protein
MHEALMHCHPERGLIIAPKREDQPQSKDPYLAGTAIAASVNSHEKLT